MITEKSNNTSPKVSIVILNWNGKEDTLECLASVGLLDYPNYEVIVVDNGSTDDSVDAVSKQYPNITLLQTGGNLGYAGGNNVGIRWVLDHDADFVFLLNNDTVVSPQLLASLVSAANRHPNAAFLGARLFYFDQPELVWFDGARWNTGKNYFEYPGQGMPTTALSSADHETDYVCGAALFIRTEIIRQVGLMDERYFLVWEEVDWCYRARQAGLRNIVVPDAVIWHKVGPSFGGEGSPLRTYFDIRNALVWSWQYTGFSTWQRILSRSLSRALPKLTVSSDKRYPLPKRFAWALLDFFRAFSRHRKPEMWVIRRAIRDYLFRKLGDCPAIVRETSQEACKAARASNRPR